MSLAELQRRFATPAVATVTVATVATVRPTPPPGVASAACVTVANVGAIAFDGVPEPWRDALLTLATMVDPPFGWPSWRHWPGIRADALALVPHAGHAAALGWTALDLWGVNPRPWERRLDMDGLAMLLDGAELFALDAESASVRTATGSVLRRYRRDMSGSVPIWILPNVFPCARDLSPGS